ncbi:MAG: polyprenyl synthetase family protein [Clostridium sp.]|uniref:polyprenyl synthetase family protein n=1 Tax=Clostridium culturomicium TaxID=1499683 RepID=UPI00058BC47B|nr:farnesyl diphosphate synthase [Clostridium culturomicium]MDU4892464.1 polyprenyl synthetase family protein [Clostridium sp.]MDU7084475.1 polyprenyl synthetase family protein [Clostridium sp.]
MDLNCYKEKIEKWIENYFDEKPESEKAFVEPMVYSLNVGGKRIRPILMMATHKMYKSNEAEVLPFAAAMEMIHTYSLIHDDLPAMDNDDLRRGKPTNHKVYGEAMAILAGDSLLNEAMSIMFDQCIDGNLNKIAAGRIISKSSGIEGMIKGQIIDIRSEGCKIDVNELKEMHRNKTGKLIVGSILAGASIAGAPDAHIEILKSFGENLGLAFQIKDDILDVEGDASLLGKSQSDGDNNKTTFVSMYGIEKCKEFCDSLTKECYDLLDKIDLNTEDLKAITEFLLKRNY